MIMGNKSWTNPESGTLSTSRNKVTEARSKITVQVAERQTCYDIISIRV